MKQGGGIKNGWDLKKIGDVCEIVNGGTPDTKVAKFWDGDNLWITPKDMGQLDCVYVEDTLRKITDEGLKNSSAKILPVNSVILSSRAPIGHLAINTKKIATNQGCKGIVPKKGVSTLFLYYFLKNSVDLLNSLGSGTTFKEISGSKLAEVPIPIPPLPEQHRIVTILDEAFAAIAKAKENAEKNLANAREVFEAYLQSVFINRGPGWEQKSLKDIGITQTGTTPSTSDKENFGNFIPFIKPADIDVHGIGDINYEGNGLSKIGMKRGRQMSSGSILMVCIGATIGKVGFTERDVSCNQQINSLTVNNGLLAKLLFYEMRTHDFFDKVMKGSAQATLPIINKSKWERLTINFPKSKSEQQYIITKLDTLLSETQKLEAIYKKKLTGLYELKKSILEKAFNGEI